MGQLIFLNERSHLAAETHRATANELLCGLVEVLIRVRQILPKAVLISSEPLPTLQLGHEYSVAHCLNGAGVIRERARLLLQMGGRAPFRVAQDLFGDPDPGVSVFQCSGCTVEGIGLSVLYGGLPVSFGVEPWKIPFLEVSVQQLTDGGENHWTTKAPHASSINHVETHHEWLTQIRRRDIIDAKDLLNRRKELFPYLEFGRNVENDVSNLQQPAFLQVVKYLGELDDSFQRWNPAESPHPDYPPHTTDEHVTRKRLCNFPDENGKIQLCSWHGRYTPGAGRFISAQKPTLNVEFWATLGRNSSSVDSRC